MYQNASTTEYKHRKFIQRVVEFEIVWGLESEEGFATSNSNEDDDTAVIIFWSDRAYANAHVKEDWSNYKTSQMPLAEFIENWLVGMHNDKILVGTNWDANMFGKESEPLQLALEIIDELKSKEKMVKLTKYEDMEDFETQIRRALE